MFEKLELTRMAQALAAQSGARMAVIAENVANADTPGYKARDMPAFAEVYEAEGLEMRATRPGHLSAPSQAAMPVASALARKASLPA